jgi:hypothetical protein
MSEAVQGATSPAGQATKQGGTVEFGGYGIPAVARWAPAARNVNRNRPMRE